MRLKATAAALLLALVPAAAMSEGCSWNHQNQSASQCPEGYTQDSTTGSCVKLTTS